MHNLNMKPITDKQLELAHAKIGRMRDYISPSQWPLGDDWLNSDRCLEAIQELLEDAYQSRLYSWL